MTNRDLATAAALQPESPEREIPQRVIKEAAKFVNFLTANGLDQATAVEGVRRFVDAIAGRRRQQKAAPGTSGHLGPLIGLYTTLYKEVYGEPLHRVSDIEVGHLAKLARDYAPQVVESRLKALAQYVKQDQFMFRLGFKPSTLANQWVRVTAYAKQHQPTRTSAPPADCKHNPPCRDAHSHTVKTISDTKNQMM